MIRIGVVLLIFGGTAKLAIRSYRQLKKGEFFKNQAQQFYKGGFNSVMNQREAQLILGIREGYTEDQIKDRHRKLMILNHPDSQGSTYIATKINEAKDILMKQ